MQTMLHGSIPWKTVCFAFVSVALEAQSTFPWGNPVIQGWEGASLYWTDRRAKPKIVVETHGIEPITVEPPALTISCVTQGGRCYAHQGSPEVVSNSSTPLGNSGSIWIWKKGEHWRQLVLIPNTLDVLNIYPLSETWFFLELNSPTEIDGKIGIWAVARIGEAGNLTSASLVDLPFKEPMFFKNSPTKGSKSELTVSHKETPSAKMVQTDFSSASKSPAETSTWAPPIQDAPGPVANRKYSRLLLSQGMAFNTFIPFNQEGGALLFHWPGYIFIFDGKGSLRKSIHIYDEFDESKFSSILSHEPVLLGAAMGPSGALLLAVREKDGVFKSNKFFPFQEMNEKTMLDPNASHKNSIDRDRLFAGINWWEVNTENGKLTRLGNTPVGAPFSILNGDQTNRFINGFPFLIEGTEQIRMLLHN